MAKLSLTRILLADFPEEYHDLLTKLLYKLNLTTEQTQSAMTNNLTMADNMSAQETVLDVTAPISVANPIFFKNTTKGPIRMIICGNAETVTGTPPTGSPFLTFEMSGTNIKVTNITNLTDGSRYNLRLYCLN